MGERATLEYNLIGLDPSFTRTGMCILTTDHKVIFKTFSHAIGKKDFEHTLDAAKSLAEEIKKTVAEFRPYRVISEHPLPQSSMSPALYCLDAMIFDRLGQRYFLQTYNPATLVKIHGTRNYTKTDSVNLAQKRLGKFLQQGWEVENIRPCHDCCEAFLYICYYLHTNGKDLRDI